jgi:lantibiotic modifying enzyme
MITQEAKYGMLASSAMESVCRALRRDGEYIVRNSGIGGGVGIGSIIYALVKTGEMLRNKELISAAITASALITPEAIDRDTALDVMGGTAGALLALVSLYEVCPDVKIGQPARACGTHLVESRLPIPGGGIVWPTVNGKALTGFAHGAAGISYALCRLYQMASESEYVEAAREGILQENTSICADAKNWLDLRDRVDSRCGTSWCHGAPGISLARIGCLASLDSVEIRRDIDYGLATTLSVCPIRGQTAVR